MTNIRLFLKIILYCGLALLASCEEYKSVIPDTAVYVERNPLVDADALQLNVAGGFDEIKKATKQTDRLGYAGILIYHGLDDEIYAFDLACTKEVKRTVRVVTDSLVTGQAVCPVCGSVFNVAYGSGNRLSGDAPEGLRRYRVRMVGGSIIVTKD